MKQYLIVMEYWEDAQTPVEEEIEISFDSEKLAIDELGFTVLNTIIRTQAGTHKTFKDKKAFADAEVEFTLYELRPQPCAPVENTKILIKKWTYWQIMAVYNRAFPTFENE